jgi:hypothetical protein
VNWKNQSSSTGNRFRGFAPTTRWWNSRSRQPDRGGNLGRVERHGLEHGSTPEAPVASAGRAVPRLYALPQLHRELEERHRRSLRRRLLQRPVQQKRQHLADTAGRDPFDFLPGDRPANRGTNTSSECRQWTEQATYRTGPPYAQATTTIFTYPVAGVEPFAPGSIRKRRHR